MPPAALRRDRSTALAHKIDEVSVSQMALFAAETRDSSDVERVSAVEAAPVSGVVNSGHRLRTAFESH
jgi:hypothetical protein